MTVYNKKELRKEIRNRKKQFTKGQLLDFSKIICNKLLDNQKVKAAKIVMLYYSLDDEVYTHELIDILIEQGKKVLLPVVLDDSLMELREYRKQDLLKEGAFNILEPTDSTYSEVGNIDVAIIPGMSFDKDGNRLGRGKGYYDRFLAQIPDAYKIGICFDFQKVELVPTEDTDIKMDEVI